MAICSKEPSPWLFTCVVLFLVPSVRVPFPFGVWDRVWNSIVSVPDHCLFIYFRYSNVAKKGIYLHNSLCRNRFHNYIFKETVILKTSRQTKIIFKGFIHLKLL